jgi:hypothetical protein
MKLIFFPYIFTFFILFTSCEVGKKDKTVENKITVNDSADIEKNDTDEKALRLNNTVRLISGKDTILNFRSDLTKKDSFLLFCKNTNKKFEKMEKLRLFKFNEWSSNILKKQSLPDSNFCFYPFAGGDFINAHYLYPNASEYLLLALEPVGSIPDFYTMEEDEILRYLINMDTVLRNIYVNSYFITKNMFQDIKRKEKVDGVLPLILWGIGRSGYDVTGAEFFGIDSLGNKTTIEKTKNGYAKSEGVTILIKKDGKEKRVTYISADMSDEKLLKSNAAIKYLENAIPTRKTTCFIKSASYLLHYNFFSSIRNLILKKSDIIVQDDTGVPYKLLNEKEWEVQLYGEYKPPLKDFSKKVFQNDLDSAYRDEKKYFGAIPFSIGYHWNNGFQSQMFIFRKSLKK